MLDLRHVRRSLWIVALLCVVVLPASASGAVTIGSNLTAAADGASACDPDCTTAHQQLPPGSTAAGGVLAPSDGVVVRWRIKVSGVAGPVALRITRPGDSDTRISVGTGVDRLPDDATPLVDEISEFNARLPIEAGDALGLDYVSTTAFANTAGAVSPRWSPRLVDGQAAVTTGSVDPELLINADIEPDADGDGYGDETQDECPTNPTTQGPCPVDPPDPPPTDPGPRSLQLFVGRFPRIHERLMVRATGFAGSPMKLWINADSRGRKCPAKPSSKGPRVRQIFNGPVEGDILVEERVKMKSRGRHSFCGYLGTARGSKLTTAVRSRLVRRQRLDSKQAKSTVVRALQRHEFAARVVSNLKIRCKRRNRATFRCTFSSTFSTYRLTGRGSVKLNRELSYRFRAKVGKLEVVLTENNEGSFPARASRGILGGRSTALARVLGLASGPG